MAEKVDFKLRDYLSPGGKYPYDRLAEHMEAELARGNTVYVWSVPGFFMLSGHPDPNNYGKKWRAWSDGNYDYKTAKDALRMKNGKQMV
jgi:hypothetical protein